MLSALIALVSSPLLQGVASVAAPGVPGPLVVFGEDAEVVVVGKSGQFQEPVVATAEYGKGRVVAFGHGGFFSQAAQDVGETRRLLRNAIDWARRSTNRPVGVHRAPDMLDLLERDQIPARDLSESELAGWEGFSLLIIDPANGAARHSASIQRFVENGGGLIVAGLGWGWLQLNPGKSLAEHPCNAITEKMGIVWADGYLDRTSSDGFAALGNESTHANQAVESLSSGKATGQTGHTLTRAIATLGRDSRLIGRLDQVLASANPGVPSEETPIRSQDVSQRVLLSLQMRRLREMAPTDIQAHPAAEFFPGVPNDSAIIAKTIRVDTSRPRWHSTGLYALPGRAIRVRTTSVAVESGLRVRIGAHSDTLWHLDTWKRAPEITTSTAISQTDSFMASAFGGSIYVEVPTGAKGATVEMRIEGATSAPHFIHGKTPDEEWAASRRNSLAPWAELESSKIILTVPSEYVRDLADAKSIMEFWDRVADACADLAAIPRERKSPERFVPDVQISAGYMHAGYPIMTHLDAAPRMVDLAFLMDKDKGGDWGMFHEIGHNHQNPDWTFGGTGEVTVNLFTLYIIETVVGRVPGYHVRWTDEQLLETFRKHRAAGAPFDKWTSDPFLALAMYVQLQQAFGWDAFKKVFAEYRALPQNERPRNDDEKRDQWMVRFSRAVGKNLGPFFVAWGVPVSDSAIRSIMELPEWNYPR